MPDNDPSLEAGVDASDAVRRGHLRVINSDDLVAPDITEPTDPDAPEQTLVEGWPAINGCVVPPKYEVWKNGVWQVVKTSDEDCPPHITCDLPADMIKRRKLVVGVPLWIAEMGVRETNARSVRIGGRSTFTDQWLTDAWVDHTELGQARRIAECLRPYGITATSGNAGSLVAYFAALEDANKSSFRSTYVVTREGYRATAPGTFNFMHAGRWYGPGRGSADPSAQSDFHRAMTKRGSMAAWTERYSRVRAFGTAARMALAASFAAPIARTLGVRPCWLFVCGPSRSGKTALAKFAMSVWGDPEKLKRTFNTTINGVLAHFNHITDLPLHLDEQQVADGKSDSDSSTKLDLSRLVYAVECGVGRSRATNTGASAEAPTWHTIVIANGEEDLVPETDLGGQKARVLSVVIDFSEERSKIAEEFHQSAGQASWGWAGPWWLEKLGFWLNDPVTKARLVASFEQMRTEVAGLTDAHPMQATQVALLAWISRMTSCLLLGTDRETAHAEALADAREIFARLPQTYQEGLAEKTLAVLRSHVATSKRVIGFGVEDGMLLLPTPAGEVLRAAGFPPSRIWRDLASRGWLVTEGNKIKVRRVVGNHGRHDGYVVRNDIWAGFDGADAADTAAPGQAPAGSEAYEERLSQEALAALGTPTAD